MSIQTIFRKKFNILEPQLFQFFKLLPFESVFEELIKYNEEQQLSVTLDEHTVSKLERLRDQKEFYLGFLELFKSISKGD